MKLKTKYTSSYLAIDMMQLENLQWTIILVNIPISILKIVFLLNSIDPFTCKKLGYFIYEAFALRNGAIDTGIVN